MRETKKQRKARLKREGRWNAFLERRRELVEDEGMSPREARAQLSIEFAPIPTGDGFHKTDTRSDKDWVKKGDFAGKGTSLPQKDIRWIFNHIGIKDVRPSDAPSAGAWGYLQAIKQNDEIMHDFYRSVYPRLLPSSSEIETESKFVDDGRRISQETIDLVAQASREAILEARAGGFYSEPESDFTDQPEPT